MLIPLQSNEPRNGKHYYRKSIFTLIELLVVISIISILMTMLLPSLSKAKNRAISLKCINQLKQLNICFQNYINENDAINCAPYSGSVTWTKRMRDNGYLGGMLAMENSDWSQLQCPRWPQKTDSSVNVYALTCLRMDEASQHYGWWYYGWSSSAYNQTKGLTNISEIPLLVDSISLADSLPHQYYTMDTLNTTKMPHTRHFKKANFAFYDGSCRPLSISEIRDISTNSNKVCQNENYCNITY